MDSEVCSDVAAENMQGVLQEQEIVRKAEEEAVFQSNVDALMERRFLRTYLCRLRLQHLQEQHTALEQIAAEMKSFSIDLGSLRVTLEKNNGHLPAGLDFVAMQTPYMLPGQSEPAAVHCPLTAASEEASEETSPNEGGAEEQVTEAAASGGPGGPSEEEAGGEKATAGKSKESKGKTWQEKLAFLRVVEVLLGQAKAKSLELEELMALLNPTPSAAMLKAFGGALEELQQVDPAGLKTLQLPLVRFDCTGLGEVYHTMLSATEVMQEVVNMSHNVKEAKSATEGDLAADEGDEAAGGGEEEASKPEGDEEGEKEQQMDEGKEKEKEITPEDVDVDQLYAMALRRIACGNALPAWINFLLEESDNRIKACGKVLRHIEALRYDDDVDSHVRRAALKQVHQLEG